MSPIARILLLSLVWLMVLAVPSARSAEPDVKLSLQHRGTILLGGETVLAVEITNVGETAISIESLLLSGINPPECLEAPAVPKIRRRKRETP